MKTSAEIRQAYKDHWTSKGFKEIPNVSLVPNNDPTLLFVNSGMFPINPYLGGQPHPLGTRLFNFQRCLRTNYDEMLEIGDNRHTLMFEMMGDWSLGDFTKQEQIPWIMDLWVNVMGIDPKRLYVTVFEGNDAAPRDDQAIKVWKETFAKYGVEAEFSEDITNIPANLGEGENWKYRIFPYPKKKNWWQRTADMPGELGGPTSEMFYDMGEIVQEQDKYHVNDDSGRFIEIGNNVFMEYKFSKDGKWELMDRKNIDFGGGFERVVMIAQGKQDIFETDVYEPILNRISQISGKEYKTDGKKTSGPNTSASSPTTAALQASSSPMELCRVIKIRATSCAASFAAWFVME
jgi:alanyl-tRNA synthetase